MGYTTKPHLKFREIPQKAKKKTRVWAILAKKDGDDLGEIRWHTGWRRYIFAPNYETYYDAECLAEIAAFLRKAMREWRASK